MKSSARKHTKAGAKKLPAHYAESTAELTGVRGEVNSPTTSFANKKLPSFYGSVLKIHLPQQRFKSKIVFDILQHWIVFDGE